MKTLKTGIKWIDSVIPEGLPLKSTTIITGPGGSGKPLIGETFVSAWLREKGSVVFMSLQYPSTEFISESIKSVTGLDISDYNNRIIFLQLNTEINDLREAGKNIIEANLVKPKVWDEAINLASSKLPDEGPGILIFGSALNLLLFSSNYGSRILEKIKNTILSNTNKTYMFLVSTTAKEKEISQIENVADNVLTSRSEKKPFRLFMKVLKMKNISYKSTEVQVPISPEILMHIKKIADYSRAKIIPAISKI